VTAPQSMRPGRLRALEKNILKYRAVEMVLILFHIEDLKSFVLTAIRGNDALDALDDDRPARLPKGVKNLYQKAWAILVHDGILTSADKVEIERLIDYRNQLAHRIQELTADIGGGPLNRDYRRFMGSKYDYHVLQRLRYYKHKIETGFNNQHIIMPLSFDALLFEPAEKVYDEELQRLNKKITRQLEIRTKLMCTADTPQ
jgi:hypothetical protein